MCSSGVASFCFLMAAISGRRRSSSASSAALPVGSSLSLESFSARGCGFSPLESGNMQGLSQANDNTSLPWLLNQRGLRSRPYQSRVSSPLSANVLTSSPTLTPDEQKYFDDWQVLGTRILG